MLDYLIDPSFPGVNRLLVFSLEKNDGRIAHRRYFFPKVQIRDYNFMIYEKKSL